MKSNRVRTSMDEATRIIAGVIAEQNNLTIQEVVDLAIANLLYESPQVIHNQYKFMLRTLPFVRNQDYINMVDLLKDIQEQKHHDAID